jgi:hypothetical protein
MIGIATAVWQRVDIFKIWAKNVKHCFPDAIVSVAYSELYYKDIIESYGFIAVWYDNRPLGHKFNAAILALKGKCNNVITTGSDDITSDSLAQFYKENTSFDYVAFYDCFFHSVELNKTKYWGGYKIPRRVGEPIGAGKMVSAKVLDELKWKPFPSINKSLDWHYHHAVMNIDNIEIKHSYLSEIKDAYLIDLKSDINMNTFDAIAGREVSNHWQKITNYELPNK